MHFLLQEADPRNSLSKDEEDYGLLGKLFFFVPYMLMQIKCRLRLGRWRLREPLRLLNFIVYLRSVLEIYIMFLDLVPAGVCNVRKCVLVEWGQIEHEFICGTEMYH